MINQIDHLESENNILGYSISAEPVWVTMDLGVWVVTYYFKEHRFKLVRDAINFAENLIFKKSL